MTSPARWRLDRQVSLGLLVAVALQAATALMWAGRASARIDDLRQRLDAQAPVAERLARLETQADATRAALARIESKLDAQEFSHLPPPDRFAVCRGEGAEPWRRSALPPSGEDDREAVRRGQVFTAQEPS